MRHFALALSDTTRGFLAALVVVICWTGFNIVSRFGSTTSLTPFDLAALRYSVSATLTVPFFVKYVPIREWPRHAALATFAGLGYGIFVYCGFSYAPAAHAGLFVNGGIPFWTVVIATILAGFHIARQTLIALLLSSSGLVLIGYHSLAAPSVAGQWIGDVLFLAAALCWAIFGLLMRRWGIKPLHGILGIAAFSVVTYMPVYLLWLPSQLSGASWGAIALQAVYQGIIAALLAAGMYSYATQKIGACEASMMLALVPAFTAIGAFFILDEALSPTTGIGIMIVSLGALLGAMPSNTLRRVFSHQ